MQDRWSCSAGIQTCLHPWLPQPYTHFIVFAHLSGGVWRNHSRSASCCVIKKSPLSCVFTPLPTLILLLDRPDIWYFFSLNMWWDPHGSFQRGVTNIMRGWFLCFSLKNNHNYFSGRVDLNTVKSHFDTMKKGFGGRSVDINVECDVGKNTVLSDIYSPDSNHILSYMKSLDKWDSPHDLIKNSNVILCRWSFRNYNVVSYSWNCVIWIYSNV